MYFPVFQKQPLIKSKTKLAKSFKTQNEQKAEGSWKEGFEALFWDITCLQKILQKKNLQPLSNIRSENMSDPNVKQTRW